MIQDFYSKVLKISQMQPQPDAFTCQSTCVAMALGRTDIMAVRQQLEEIGQPGDS